MELALIVGMVLVVGMYYGFGRNLEVASGMLTRELEDAERMQKVRVVKRNAKAELSDSDWKASVKSIKQIDALEI